MRDMYKIAESAKVNERYSLNLAEVCQLMETLPGIVKAPVKGERQAAYDLIVTAFKYGYVMGSRAEKKKQREATKS